LAIELFFGGYKMKKCMALILTGLCINAMANHGSEESEITSRIKCRPYKLDVRDAQAVVDVDAPAINELETKQSKIQRQLDNKMATLQPYLDQKADLDQDLISLNADIQVMSDSILGINSLILQIQGEIEDNIAKIERLERNMNRSNRRTTMRKVMALKKQNEAKQLEIDEKANEISRINTSIGELEDAKSQKLSLIRNLSTTINEVAETRPRLSKIKSRMESVNAQLDGLYATQSVKIEALELAKEKLDMCVTYKVKYPFGKKVMKQLYNVGCNRYVSIAKGKKVKEETENDIIDTVCR
jgi:chromosome segregation ATPase